ncbi:MAG: hypothetical protein QM762_18205 [Chryseolinea sp.]
MNKYIILVGGYDYNNGGVNFAFIADRRRMDLLRQNPQWQTNAEVIFVRFDVRAGKIDRNIYNGSSRVWQDESTSHTAIVRSQHYRENHLVSAESNIMSITDIYRYVVNIGSTEPGTLYEFSILSHGWFGGPVLLNSFQRDEFSTGARAMERDPTDKDGRSKDFQAQNMSDDDWNNFRRAFSADGYYWVWGCLFSRAYFDTLYKIMQTPAYRSKALGSHADSDTFSITVSEDFVSKHYQVDPTFFPTNRSERTFTRSLIEIKKFMKRGLRRSYPGRVALDTGVTCIAAYLGTYSDYERSHAGHSAPNPVMVIPRNMSAYGCDFTTTINFFKTYLGLAEDVESRGYAIYSNVQALDWWNNG